MRKDKYKYFIMSGLLLWIFVTFSSHFIQVIPSFVDKPSIHSSYALFIEKDSGEVLYKKNETKKTAPASLTKMMTILVALDKIENLSAETSIDSKSYNDMVEKNSSMAGFVPGEKLTYRDLLYGAMLNSGGEAANSLALSVCENQKNFVDLMNEKAKKIGMNDTHFTNVEGFDDPDQYSTAKDMALLVSKALDNGHFRVLFTTPTFRTSTTSVHPEGLLLSSTVLTNLPEMTNTSFSIAGGKSGTTLDAGECWATLGEINGKEYISVVMGAQIDSFKSLPWHQKDDTLTLFSYVSSEMINE